MTKHTNQTSDDSQAVLPHGISDPSTHEDQIEPAAYELNAQREVERDSLDSFGAALYRAQQWVRIAVEQDVDAERAAALWPNVRYDPKGLEAAKKHGYFPPGRVSIDGGSGTRGPGSKYTMYHYMRFCFPAALKADQEQSLKTLVTQILCSDDLFENISFERVCH